ncbi:myelin protein zero-like protein 2 isoform X1 [Echeneis naucrates]|nr:myelin protein zero-like protein 2 isoform X1 [Echeneis naucrates]
MRAATCWDAFLDRQRILRKLHDFTPIPQGKQTNKQKEIKVDWLVWSEKKESLGGSVGSRSVRPSVVSSGQPAVPPMCVMGLYVFTVLSGLAASGVLQVSGIRISTSGPVEAVNGTDVRLKCSFQTSAPINVNSITVSWTFRPLVPGREESVFHFQQKPYPPVEGIFRKRIAWDGDIMSRDASIIIRQVKFIYNGTYVCQVKNPPDVHGNVGEIRLRVVTTASFSELLILALAIGGGIAAVVILLVIILSCRRLKRKRQRPLEVNEEAPRKERKDPTACHPSRAVHLYMSETSIEIDSSDGMISDASTKDSSSSEEEDPSSDDDDGGDDSD